MRVLLLTLLLVAGSQANFLTDIGDAFATTFNQLVDTGKQVGQSLLDELKVTGAQLASQSLQALMLNVGSALTATDAPAAATDAAAKRELAQELVKPLNGLDGIVTLSTNKLKTVYQTALSAFGGLAHQLTEPGTYAVNTLEDFLAKIDRVIADHSQTSDALVQQLTHEVSSLLPTHKRSLLDSLGAVGQGLSSIFQPHVDVLKTLVSSVGQVLRDTATQLFGNLMSSVMNLGTQLLGGEHATAIQHESQAVAQSGTDAVSSLKDVVGDIMHQTIQNIQPHLTNIAGHLISGLLAGKK